MTSLEQQAICTMFDRIASTYDGLNRFLSFGQDQRWRRAVANLLPKNQEIKVLDVATGTGDLLFALCNRHACISEAHGVDLASNMLKIAQEKAVKHTCASKIVFKQADACALPFGDGYFDRVTIAFGIRNVTDKPRCLRELARVLKPGGQALILEFSLPKNWLIRLSYLFYFRHVLPFVGGVVSKDKHAYRYLNRTVESFISPKMFESVILKNGFSSMQTVSLTFGVATLYCAGK